MEFLDIIDKNGEPTGKIVERSEAHRKGIAHRTSHVWLCRKNNGSIQILLQKRSNDKDSNPGCYDISSAGHIPAGSGFLDSAIRELSEELGINADKNELIYCGQRHFLYENVFYGKKFIDNQTSNVYLLKRDIDAQNINFQKEEIQSVMWIDYYECVEKVKNNEIPNCIVLEELNMIGNNLLSLDF
ncbi:MAG: NUDIX domain-containing protein [Clostridia bacterium]|nr:NUDIX domain-containing protein [Clostridia bacterium]